MTINDSLGNYDQAIIEPFHGKTYDSGKNFRFSLFVQKFSSFFKLSSSEILGSCAGLLQRYEVVDMSDEVEIFS